MIEHKNQQVVSVPARTRRTKNWWEPMFSGENCCDFKISDWDFSNNEGPRNLLFRADEIEELPIKAVKKVSFKDCDFQGEFKTQLIFSGCKFERCDLGLSRFHRAKFSNCTLVDTSFSQLFMENCELRNCDYIKISFSGNETQLPRTLITEPSKFIFGGKAATDNLPNGKSAVVQKLRFEETRSTLSRGILANLQSEGSEDTYYSAVRTASQCEDRARFAVGALRLIYSLNGQKKQTFFARLWDFFYRTSPMRIVSSKLFRFGCNGVT